MVTSISNTLFRLYDMWFILLLINYTVKTMGFDNLKSSKNNYLNELTTTFGPVIDLFFWLDPKPRYSIIVIILAKRMQG